jgi:hypothetical protein
VIVVERLLSHRLDDVGRDHQDGVAVADHDVAGIDRHPAAGDRQLQVDRLVGDRAGRRGRPAVIGRQPRLEHAVGVAEASVGHDACGTTRLQPADVEIAAEAARDSPRESIVSTWPGGHSSMACG